MSNFASPHPEFIKEPELVFGLVGAVGTDLQAVIDALTQQLDRVSYNSHIIHLSETLRSLVSNNTLYKDDHERISASMDLGDSFRSSLGQADALAFLAIEEIRRLRCLLDHQQAQEPSRNDHNCNIPKTRTAYIIRQLKTPSEVFLLRSVYGRAFYLISCFSPPESRIEELSSRIARSRGEANSSKCRSDAQSLIYRDEKDRENKEHGQNVLDTFPEGDIFINATSQQKIASQLQKFISLLFSHPFITPSRDEFGMFHASAAARRSADLSRQVGAAIATDDGDIISVGCNDVPKPFGGQYWDGDVGDNRDFLLGYDSSQRSKSTIAAQIATALIPTLEESVRTLSSEEKDATLDKLKSLFSSENILEISKDTQLMDLLEFGRPVHAEMAALMGAARRGVSVQGSIMYSTTFPCHMCARHIIASGIKKVIYIEPYPKSMVGELYRDSISVDPVWPSPLPVTFSPFEGVSPRQYFDIFDIPPSSKNPTKKTRKDQSGNAINWEPRRATPKNKTDGFFLHYNRITSRKASSSKNRHVIISPIDHVRR